MYKDRFIKLNVTAANDKYEDTSKPYYFLIDNIVYVKENCEGSRTKIRLSDGSTYYSTTKVEYIVEEINKISNSSSPEVSYV